jgi:nucleoside 2-deoxyribosyltransferase
MNMATVSCPVCKWEPIGLQPLRNIDAFEVDCPRCGKYKISGTATVVVGNDIYDPDRHLISGHIRNKTEDGDYVVIMSDSLKDIVKQARPPRNPFEAMDRLIQYAYRKSPAMGESVCLNLDRDYSLIYAKGSGEFGYILDHARKLDYLTPVDPDKYTLGLAGWKRLDELRRHGADSNQAFVAMWFNDDLIEVWEMGFRLALEEAGYEPLRIDLKLHNNKICDEIIAEIRKSGLLVADFTGQRGGVYFEAGFAMGLGIPVIWTCRKDPDEKLHFDTRQYNHIFWETPDDLRKQLLARINATAPRRKNQ